MKRSIWTFRSFFNFYRSHFIGTTRQNVTQALQYSSGLMQSKKKNMERMAEIVQHADEQSLHHFIANAKWSARDVMDHVAHDLDDIYGESSDTCLIIDESGIPKKGEKSVGVARQYCGQLGKVDNCQVGVFACLAREKYVTMIDGRLYLPKSWVEDPERCRVAGVPEEEIIKKSKCDLALEMVRHARSTKIRFNWIGVDGGYGKDPSFLRSLDRDGETFVADVHSDQRIYLEDPDPKVLKRKIRRGRMCSILKAQTEHIRVDEHVAHQPNEAWSRVVIREGTRGDIEVDIFHTKVWLWDGTEEKAHLWHMITRREVDSPEKIKYSLSNAYDEIPTNLLAHMQGQRYWVERSIQDAKTTVGLGDYQVRSWNAWHHHMSLVMFVLLFLLKLKVEHQKEYPLLSCNDVVTLVAYYLPKKDSVRELLRQLDLRHKKRESAIRSTKKRKRHKRKK